MIFFVKNEEILDLANKTYLLDGLALFIFKLICFAILLISQYSFYLKFKAVYLSLDNDPRDEILSSYKKLRIIFITKIFILWIVGFITICMELIILCFIKVFIKLQTKEPVNIQIKKPKPPEPKIEQPHDIVHNSMQSNEKLEGQEKRDHKEIDNNIDNNQSIATDIKPDNEKTYKLSGNSPPPSANRNIEVNNPFNKIELIFQLIETESNNIHYYKINVKPSEKFSDIENRLKCQYPDLKEKQLDVFMLDGTVINKNNSVEECKIEQNVNNIIKINI